MGFVLVFIVVPFILVMPDILFIPLIPDMPDMPFIPVILPIPDIPPIMGQEPAVEVMVVLV
jgi:hypothetical protein